MSAHGLADMTLGVPRPDDAAAFYRAFGLAETTPGTFATSDGGDQLHLRAHPYRRLLAVTMAVDDADDVARVAASAHAASVEVTSDADGSITVSEPIVGLRVRVAVAPRVSSVPSPSPPMNGPGNLVRDAERAPAIFAEGPARPRRLGHVLYTTTDLDASIAFLTGVLGFRMSDSTPGLIAFLRCSTDHHNIGLINAPVPFFHHSSWQVNDLDEIGRGAHHLLADDPDRSVWGLGRHFLGSNLFWYFRDPAGNYAEYFADLDQIAEDADWLAREWDPSKSLYAWGPPVPADFVHPRDVAELAAAMAAAG